MTNSTVVIDGRDALSTTELCRRLGVGSIPISQLKRYGAKPVLALSHGKACYWLESDVPALARMIAQHLMKIEAKGR